MGAVNRILGLAALAVSIGAGLKSLDYFFDYQDERWDYFTCMLRGHHGQRQQSMALL